MTELDSLLGRLSPRGRVAATAACVEHVLDIYRRGNFAFEAAAAAPLLDAQPDADLLEAILKAAWRFVEQGSPADPAARQAVSDVTSKNPDDIESEEMSMAALGVVGASAQLLAATFDPTPASARESITNSACAVADMIDAIEDPEPDEDASDAAYEEEQAWQRRLIERVVQAELPPSRSDVQDLIAEPLSWRRFLDGYENSIV